jgi:hypothetical protein
MLNLTNSSFYMNRLNQSAISSFQIISDGPISGAILSYYPPREHSVSASAHRPDTTPLFAIKTSRTVVRTAYYQDLPNRCTYRLLRHTCHQDLPNCCTYRLLRHTCHQDLPNCCTYRLLRHTFLSLCSKLTNTNEQHGFD